MSSTRLGWFAMAAFFIVGAVWYVTSAEIAVAWPAVIVGVGAGWLLAKQLWIPLIKRSILRGTAGTEMPHPAILALAIGSGLVVIPAALRGLGPTVHAQVVVALSTCFGVSLGVVALDQELMARLDSVLKARRRGSP